MDAKFINQVFLYSGLSKKEFAEKISISSSTLNKWIAGKSEPLFLNQKIIRQVFKEEVSKIS